MKSYYCILEFDSDEPLFLGKIPLEETEEGLALDAYDGQQPIATDGTVPRVWGPEDESSVPLPDEVDTADPFQVAPMASFYERPCAEVVDVIEDEPEAVHVFTIDPDDKTRFSNIEGVGYYENVISEKEGGIAEIDRGYEWDGADINMDVSPGPTDFSAATFVIGFTNKQEMHDPYTHLGTSTADGIVQAFYNVLSELLGIPLSSPEAYSVGEHQTFEPTAVLNDE
jgi:uncharacterized protein YciU (UPF0263 family)